MENFQQGFQEQNFPPKPFELFTKELAKPLSQCISEIGNVYFLTAASSSSCEFRSHRAGSQLKILNSIKRK